MLQIVIRKCESKFSPLYLTVFLVTQYAAAFLLGVGLQGYGKGGDFFFGAGAISSLLLLTVSCIVLPIYSRRGKSFAIFGQHFAPLHIFIPTGIIASLICFGILQPIAFFHSQSWLAISGWGPLCAILVTNFLNFLLVFIGSLHRAGTNAVTEEPLISEETKLQAGLKKYAPFFFASYFLLIVAPYAFAKVSFIDSILVSSGGRIAYRLFTTAYFFIYALLIGWAFKKPINLRWLFPLTLTMLSFIVAWLFLPRGFSYSAVGKMGSVTQTVTYVSHFSLAISFFLYAVECGIFLTAISWLPQVVTRKAIIIFFSVVTAFVLLSCVISFILDYRAYFSVASGSNYKGISSIFHHKNEFGAMLFLGLFSSVFAFHYIKSRARFAFLACSFVFLVVSIFVRCYTGLLPMAALAFVALIFDIAILWQEKRVVALIISVAAIATITFAFVGIFVPSVRDSVSFLSSIYRNFEAFEGEIISRTRVWNASFHLLKGPELFIGKTDPIANSQLTAYLEMTSITSLNDYHSAFVSFFTNHGISGLMIYLGIIVFIYIKCIQLFRLNRKMGSLLLMLLSSCVLFSMPESYTLFLNMSALAFPSLALFVIFLPILRKEHSGAC